jgi:hypothetical protein
MGSGAVWLVAPVMAKKEIDEDIEGADGLVSHLFYCGGLS